MTRVADSKGRIPAGRIIGLAPAVALAALALASCSGPETETDNSASVASEPVVPAAPSNAAGVEFPAAATDSATAAAPDGGAADLPADPAAAPSEPQPAAKAAAAKAGAKSAQKDGPAANGPCERLTAAEARKATGLKPVGSAGAYRFFSQPRALLCSEPGTGGVGECEIVGSTVIRVEHGGESYGLRSRAGTPALLRYGPSGVSCISPSR